MKKVVTAMATAVTLSTVMTGNAFAAEKYEVKQGDTLWKISHDNKTTVNNLKQWNHLYSDMIFPNEKLVVSPKDTYTVQDNDTLWGIAKNYHVTVDQLKQWNHLQTDLIQKGDKLDIYSSVSKVDDRDEHAAAQVTSASISDKAGEEKAAAPATQPEQKAAPEQQSVSGKEISVKATAYTADCAGCSGTTATGMDVKDNSNAKVIAVDPKVIPLGSKVYVEGYGYAIAGDTGGAIKGNRIDVLVSSNDKAMQWGVRHIKVTIIN
ncbi:3D domain-containing protein [Heyndrickxia acidicola]|uniref:LysM peptidoglycan-binding domain-containing protein n=1 Tax=Heyndrickxia acidicola TaxID=209389 RepID=A0ABU6MA84_9BACI|nr:3D domain-containing protein [Heyndrickxia acidicola]MED1201578.1 LysM peptidoglycan-binding domain-containing protein [Heyndrickxia acidicola]